MKSEFKLSPIGQVSVTEDGFQLMLDEAYAPALNGLDGFAWLQVVWWADQFDNAETRAILTMDKPYTNGPATMGIFATRSPVRPNPICVTPVAALHIDHTSGVIQIPFIDAEDGTPILDIKPYTPSIDRISDVAVPDWCAHWPQWLEESATFDWAAEFEFA